MAWEHTLLAGLELGRQDSTNKRNTGVFGAATLATVPASAPFAVATSFPGVASDADNNVKADTAAVYLQDQIALAKEWKLLAGLRYDHFKTAFDDSRPVPTDLARTDKEWSPRLGLIWSPTPTSTYYASYSYAFLPSGEQLSLAPNTADLAPEKAKNYEIGGRWDLLPEIAPSAAPAGARLQLVPQNTLSVWNRFDAGNGWGAGLGVIYQGDSYAALDNVVTLPAFTRADAALYYTFAGGKTRLALNVENLFDSKYFPTADGNNNISPGAPRGARLTLSTAF